MTNRYNRFGALAVVVAVLAATWWLVSPRPQVEPAEDAAPATLRDPAGPLSLAATGDSMIVQPWPDAGRDAGFDGIAAILTRASLAVTNVEQVLMDGADASAQGWPVGSLRVAEDLRRIGVTVATRANNHAADRGEDGVRGTSATLARAGLLYTGAGLDLDQARVPVFLGTRPKRIAVIAVTTSAPDEASATRTRGEIRGRPGVNTLRYAMEITADPATFAALASVAQSTGTETRTATSFQLSGRLVKKGTRTSVDLAADARDRDELLDAIAAARAEADVVVVALHSHEPGNLSQQPAAFVRDFAHQAIERGASIIVGSGPRQLRGIEIYRGRPIFYSLGNFAFDAGSIRPGSADVFDSNTNLMETALGQAAPPRLPTYDEAVWWESVVATTTFESDGATRIRLEPLDLGADLPPGERGRPRLASKERGDAILRRIAELSKAYETVIDIKDGAGTIVASTVAASRPASR